MTYSASTQYMLDTMKRLLATDSPTGFTRQATDLCVKEFEKLGIQASETNKGCVLAELGGEGNPVIVTAHIDTLGGIETERFMTAACSFAILPPMSIPKRARKKETSTPPKS